MVDGKDMIKDEWRIIAVPTIVQEKGIVGGHAKELKAMGGTFGGRYDYQRLWETICP
jgi:hypothetical protein